VSLLSRVGGGGWPPPPPPPPHPPPPLTLPPPFFFFVFFCCFFFVFFFFVFFFCFFFFVFFFFFFFFFFLFFFFFFCLFLFFFWLPPRANYSAGRRWASSNRDDWNVRITCSFSRRLPASPDPPMAADQQTICEQLYDSAFLIYVVVSVLRLATWGSKQVIERDRPWPRGSCSLLQERRVPSERRRRCTGRYSQPCPRQGRSSIVLRQPRSISNG